MNDSLIQVLWVEDDPEITQTYPLEAAIHDIQLVPFSCWQEAEKALESDFKRWSAIVLDAKCKYKKDSHDNATQFLMQALVSIARICAQHYCIIPWYILSGGSEEELSDLINDSREEWDSDWGKNTIVKQQIANSYSHAFLSMHEYPLRCKYVVYITEMYSELSGEQDWVKT